MGEDKSIQLAQPIKSCLEELAGWFNESSIPYTTIGGIASINDIGAQIHQGI